MALLVHAAIGVVVHVATTDAAESSVATPPAAAGEIAGSAAPLAAVASPTEDEATLRRRKLVEEFTDPLTELPQIFLKDAFTPSNFATEGRSNVVTARAIVPRIPRFTLLPFVQLLRPSISLVTFPTGKKRGTETAFGDMALFDILVAPWPDRSTGFYMGAGPLLVFPTATDDRAGDGAWQAGPVFAALYKGMPGVIFGALIQNPISFAYTSGSRPAVSTLVVQPILAAYLGHGFYLRSADASSTMGWHAGSPTVIPLSFGLGYVYLSENAPPVNFYVSGEWTAYRQFAPVAPQTTVQFGVTVAFPDFRPW